MPKKIPAIAILDIGKTNKKAFLFDESYQIVHEQSEQLPETTDEDGFPCEDIHLLHRWIKDSLRGLLGLERFDVKAFNVSAYGASFVHLDATGEVIKPLYNYLKPYPPELEKMLHSGYGGTDAISLQTASPPLGNLNSGLQLYWLAKRSPNIFTQVNNSLHLPQFASWVVTGQAWSDMTSIGCHTMLWDFSGKKYHPWVGAEGPLLKLPPIYPSDEVMPVESGSHPLLAGVGLHDSSAALIPYLAQFDDPFLLLSTGTWNICLNPFSSSPLTAEQLRNDCLCYLDYKGNPVKSSRLFAGHAHEQQTKRIADHFNVHPEFYKRVRYDETPKKRLGQEVGRNAGTGVYQSAFSGRELDKFDTAEMAYHQLMLDLVADQVAAIRRVIDPQDDSSRIFVDGGFGQNDVFMNLLCSAFPDKHVLAASVHQASALGAALAIHRHWNTKPIPGDLIALKRFG